MVKFWHERLSNISPKAVIGNGTVVHAGVHIHDHVRIGKDCQIEAGVFIPNGVVIEDNVFVGPGVIFTNDSTMRVERLVWAPEQTVIMSGAKIGAGSIIRAGLTIGKKAVVGMGSVVVKNVKNGEVVVGNPARAIRKEKVARTGKRKKISKQITWDATQGM